MVSSLDVMSLGLKRICLISKLSKRPCFSWFTWPGQGRQGGLFTTTALVCHSYSQQWTEYWGRANLLTVGENGSASHSTPAPRFNCLIPRWAIVLPSHAIGSTSEIALARAFRVWGNACDFGAI